MAKDWEDLSYHKKDKKLLQMAEQYGIDPRDYARNARESGAYGGKGDWDDFTNAVLQAGANDYDTRRSIEAGKASGNKRFDDIGDGISNIGELNAVNRAMKKTHKDMGNTGNFSSANDYGNVTNHLVKAQAKSAKDQIMQGVQDQIEQAMSGDKKDDDSNTNSYSPSYNEFYGLEGEVRKASSGFGATNTPASEAQNMLFNTINKIAKDDEMMEDAKFNQDKYALELGNQIFKSQVITMAFTDEQLKGWGLTAVESGTEDEGVINDGNGNYYQINNFQRGKNEGLDEDKGGAFNSSLYKDAQAEGYDVTSFNTINDVQGAIRTLAGSTGSGEDEPGMSWNDALDQGILSPQAQEAVERVQIHRDSQHRVPDMIFRSPGSVNSTREETGATASDKAAASAMNRLDDDQFKMNLKEDIRNKVQNTIASKY